MDHSTLTTETRKFRFAGETHLGLIRKNNEDSFLYYSDSREPNSLVVVADGIGGLENGEVASQMCCAHFLEAWRDKNVYRETSEKKLCSFLRREIDSINSKIYSVNKKEHKKECMGTTVVVAIFCPDKVIVTHAGDSRMYRIRNGHLNPLTEDHSFINALIQKNIIDHKEAEAFPFSNVIIKSLGPMEKISTPVNIFFREPEDRFIICSDGLTSHLSDNRIEKVMKNSLKPEIAVDKLMRGALIKGGSDNITIVCGFPEYIKEQHTIHKI